MCRVLSAVVIPALALVACAEPLDPFDPAFVDTGALEAEERLAAGHDGKTACGDQDVEVYENTTANDMCVHATFTNNCTSDMDIEPGTDGKEQNLDSGKTKTYSFTIPKSEKLTLDCDGSDVSDVCGGCSWSLSFGGSCATEGVAAPMVF